MDNVTYMHNRRFDIQRFVDGIKQLMYDHAGTMSVAEVIGAIEIAKIEIYNEHMDAE